MRLPNLLASKNGRLTAFFFLYMTEGIPLGFAATAVATQLRRMGVGPAEIGVFIASFYLPWAFKWAFGPFIDVFRSQRFGHRRGWILLTQLIMAATLFSLILVPLPQGLWLFTIILLVHNTFGAMQDVAIDSLACNTLQENERGLANGMMFAGAAVGQAVGGSGVLYLMSYLGFQSSFVAVALAILAVTTFIVLPMKEAMVEKLESAGSGLNAALGEMRSFAVQSFRSFIGSKGAFAGVFFALLPAGAMSLGLALQSNLSVELGMDDDQVATLSLWSSLISAASMVIGGMLSDKLGRRITLLFYISFMSLPVLYLMWELQRAGYIFPRAPGSAPIPELISVLWIATMVYSVFNGLMYGTRSAIFMDVTNPTVAATQFTAYMAMMNLAIAFAATWQGLAIEAWGYPTTLLIDAIFGLTCLLLLPKMKAADSHADTLMVGRARKSALVLGLLCLAYVPVLANLSAFGKGQPILGTFYTLVFIASALFMLAGREVLGGAGILRRAALWSALGLLLMTLIRKIYADGEGAAWALQLNQALQYTLPVLAGLTLIALSRQSWAVLETQEPASATGTTTTAA